MGKEIISTKEAPAAIGPYSQGVKAEGKLVFTAGQIAIDPATGEMVGKTIEEQTHQVLKNIQAVLRAAGADLSNVVKTTVFLANIGDFARMNEVYSQYFRENPPARSAFGNLHLPKGALVEIECVAVL